MKNRIVALVLYILLFTFFVCSCSNKGQNMQGTTLFVDEDCSWFCDFSVSENYVQFKCHLCLVNQTDEMQTVYLLGNFKEDVKGGLVFEENILASSQDDPSDSKFLLLPGANTFDVVFVGTYGGTHQKANRLLPSISIIKYFDVDSYI